MPSVAVLGGGISGLSTAYYLSRLLPPHVRVRLIEASQRVGGWINSEQGDDGVLFEGGPRTLRPHGTSGTILLDLIRDLDLKSQIVQVPKSHPSAQHRYIEYDGVINQLPSGLGELLFKDTPVMRSVVTAGALEPFRARGTGDDESLYSFMTRRFNEHTALNLMGAMAHGIYAGDAKKLSVQSTFPILAACEKEFGSVVLGMLAGKIKMESKRERSLADQCLQKDPEWYKTLQQSSVIGFLPGLEALSRSLAQHLAKQSNVDIVLGQKVTKLEPLEHKMVVTMDNGTSFEAEHVVSALPTHALARIATPEPLPHLTHNPSADVAVVNLAYDKDTVSLDLDGFGFLTPHRDAQPASLMPGLLGVIFDTNSLGVQDEETNTLRFTAMIGGSDWDLAFPGVQDDASIESRAIAMATGALDKYLHIHSPPLRQKCHIQRQCIPQYMVGHRDRMADLHAAIHRIFGPRLSVTGAGYLGVSVPDCVKHGRLLAEDLARDDALGNKTTTGLEKATQPLYYLE
ncbi:hypothetical protein BC940DRAFT_269365 [Gongronella butleri]|nr:hypothetical protein BC940DRAFT_269365 [Gongronella butleri]